MKRYGNLFEKIALFKNLYNASKKAFKGRKKYSPQGSSFFFNLENELIRLEDDLLSGQYKPGPYYHFTIYDPKFRQICAANFRDRVLHHGICNVIEPIFEKIFIHDSYACRKGKGTHTAIKRAQFYARKFDYFIKCDIRKYFETIDHQVLISILNKKFKDKKLLDLLSTIIQNPYPGGIFGKGVPIGNLTSQLFANLYLDQLDHIVKEQHGIKGYVRYMDDFLLFDNNKAKLHDYLSKIRNFINNTLLLEIKENEIVLAPVTQGIEFLGFRIFRKTIRMQRNKLVRFRRKIRKREKQYIDGEISEDELINSVRSMIAHISHYNTFKMRQSFFHGIENI